MHSSQKAVASNQLTELLLAGKKTSVLLVERYGTAAGKAQEDFPAKLIALIAHGGVICGRQRKSLLLFFGFRRGQSLEKIGEKTALAKKQFLFNVPNVSSGASTVERVVAGFGSKQAQIFIARHRFQSSTVATRPASVSDVWLWDSCLMGKTKCDLNFSEQRRSVGYITKIFYCSAWV